MMEMVSKILARRIIGPVKPDDSWRGTWATGEAAYKAAIERRARLYLYCRHVARYSAETALGMALGAKYESRRHWKQYYGPKGGAGAAFDVGGESLRWIESTADAGLRFVGYADKLARLRHTGWHMESDGGGDVIRGAVWQVAGKGGQARLVYGYVMTDWKGEETNPGAGAVCLSPVAVNGADLSDESADVARQADRLAEIQAEKEREYRDFYDSGRRAAELDSEQRDGRKEAAELATEIRRARKVESPAPVVCAALRAQLNSLLRDVRKARDKRDSLWTGCPTWGESAWLEGFTDESPAGPPSPFARYVAKAATPVPANAS